jgi:radical SAM protein with 4Fe4S-binding SPASM domain
MKYLDKKGRHFFISTNGSPLRQKHVDFFKSLEASVMMAVSHDGPGQELLRGEDILYKDSVIKTLKQLDDLFPKVQFSFNCVVSLQNHDLFKINDYFRKASDRIGLKNIRLSYILGRIYDATNSQNSADHVMNKDALVEFKKILNDYIEAEIQQLKTLGFSRTLPMLQSNLVSGEIGAYSYAKKMRHQVPITMTSNCGADAADILSLDIMGNIRLCPHTSENYIAGHINNLKGIRIVQLDLNRKKTHCADCNVRRLCKSSCPIEFPDEVFLQNCRVEKVWYGAIQNKALKLIFGEDVELVELGIQDINEDRLKENSRTQVVA